MSYRSDPERSDEPARRSALRILLVEDDPIHARIMRAVLSSADMPASLTHVRDGESAVAMMVPAHAGAAASRIHDGAAIAMPDLMLLDIRLPRIDGFEVLEAIRRCEATRHLPVVVVSTSDRPEDINRCYRLGANAYICKSPDFDVFADRLATMCRFWHVTELPSFD